MKTNTTLLIMLAALFACKNPKKEVKLSPETKLELSGFKSSWDATGDQLEAWGNRLHSSTNEIRNIDSTALSQASNNPSAKVKSMADSLEANHSEVTVRLAILADTYEKLQAKWNDRDSLFRNWEENLRTGELEEAKAKESLEPFKEFQGVVNTALIGMEKELSTARQEVVPLAQRVSKASKK